MSGWSAGTYELTARRLEPAAEVAADAVAPSPGDRVLDVACGTGNAALALARRGAAPVGVDSAERLVEVARQRAAADGLEAEFAVADATSLPFPDAEFAAAVSVFGVIFAEPEPAAAELLRVVRPGGRILLTTWITGGLTNRVMAVVRDALGAPPETPRWSSPAFVEQLFAPRPVTFAEQALSFSAASPRAYLDEQLAHHPMWLAAAPALERSGRTEEVLTEVERLFTTGNEDASAFRTTSTYHLVTIDV